MKTQLQFMSENALLKAGFLCEVDKNHLLFVRRNSNKNYTEPHHLVPLYAQKDFPDVNLDREQNIVSLCSHCHNLLHYGADVDAVLFPLYQSRKELLEAIGVAITYEKLKKYYICKCNLLIYKTVFSYILSLLIVP